MKNESNIVRYLGKDITTADIFEVESFKTWNFESVTSAGNKYECHRVQKP